MLKILQWFSIANRCLKFVVAVVFKDDEAKDQVMNGKFSDGQTWNLDCGGMSLGRNNEVGLVKLKVLEESLLHKRKAKSEYC